MKYIFFSLITICLVTSCEKLEAPDYTKQTEAELELEREVDRVCQSTDRTLINSYIENRKYLMIRRPAEAARWEAEINRFKNRLIWLDTHTADAADEIISDYVVSKSL